ncbi:MAG: hypothetical protein N2170_03145, partial [Bacteroidia bacterium]|nr:hypothetical protein [Bacteroidia bacterium]
GVRAIHYVDPDRPELYCSEALFDLDGVWPSGVSTVTPSNGPAALGLLNSPRYPLLPDPGNSCLTVTSASINTSTGSIYVGYTIQSTEGFLYGVTTRLPGGPECESGLLPFNLPPNLVQADSVAPNMPYVYALCSPDDWGSQLDSLDGFLWPPSSTAFSPAPCEPCNWYNPVEGTFYWRCFRGEGGYVVNNFTYQGEVNPIPDFFQSVTVNLSPRRVPDKVRLISVPSNLVSPGTSFILSAELVDSLTPATWGQFGSPNFSSCSFTTATLHILTAGGASVSSHTASVQAGSGGAPTMQFTGTWPLTPGQYKVVVEGLPFPTCGCGAAPTSGWRASDTLLVEVGMSTTLSMEVRSEGNLWAVSLPQAEGQLLLYDSQGRLVWRGGAALRVGIPRDLLSPGLYTLVWQSSKEVISRKLLHISP